MFIEVGTVWNDQTDHEASKAYRPGTCFRRNKRNLKQLQQDTPYLRAEVEVIDESDLVIQDDLNGEAMARSLKDTFLDYAARNGKMSKEAVAEILGDQKPEKAGG